MNKKDLVIVVLATFCLTSTIFMMFPTKSAEPYNPWADVSGPTIGEPDGTINMRDINYEILRFNTFGDTAKNITIAGRVNKLIKAAVNVIVSSGGGYWSTGPIDVDGYDRVTVLIYMNVTDNIYYLRTYDATLDTIWSLDQQTDFNNYLVKTYDVVNQRISIGITNMDPSRTAKLYIDIYLVP